jgi:hypothetical protein
VTAAWIAAVAATVVALISAFLSYNTTRRLSRRSDQIAFVNRQLSELYGPLLALSRTSAASWAEFRKRYGADRPGLFPKGYIPTEEEVHAWKYWLKHVFMPMNRRIFDAILAKTDLIEGDGIPQVLVDLCAHVTGYEVTLARWEDGDYSSLVSVIDYPGSVFDEYIKMMYRELKMRQTALLGNDPRANRWERSNTKQRGIHSGKFDSDRVQSAPGDR